MNDIPPKPTITVEAEPFIPYIAEDKFDQRLKPIVDPYKKRMGFVPNALKLYAHRPEIAETLFALNSKVMRDPSSHLPQLLKRKVAAICCAVNGCSYCTAHSCSMLKRASSGDPLKSEGWGLGEAELQGIIDGTAPPASDIERVCFAYARAASADAPNVPDAILADLKKHLTPPQIVELACVIGFWKFYNAVHDSLHIPIERDLLGDTGYVRIAARG
jgi:alkylhydroperoxidase family enzyme